MEDHDSSQTPQISWKLVHVQAVGSRLFFSIIFQEPGYEANLY